MAQIQAGYIRLHLAWTHQQEDAFRSSKSEQKPGQELEHTEVGKVLIHIVMIRITAIYSGGTTERLKQAMPKDTKMQIQLLAQENMLVRQLLKKKSKQRFRPGRHTA